MLPVMAEPRIINYNGTYVSFRQINRNSTIVKINLKRIWSKEYSNYKKKSLNWRNMIILSFNKDVLKCPICQNIMIYYKYDYP